MSNRAEKSGLRVAYLCSLYPAISHTFVLREVAALRARGLEISTFSIHRAHRDHLLAEADRAAFASTYAILPPRWGALLKAHVGALAAAPRAYIATLALAMRLAPLGLRSTLWQVFYFLEAVVLQRECARRGIRHIHVHMGNVGADAALLAAELGSASEPERSWSWSLTLHGPDELVDVSRFRIAEKLLRAQFVVCISDYTRSQLMTLSDPASWEKLRVIHVGIPIEQFTPSADESLGEPYTDVLCIGRHVPQKGHLILLEAIAMLAERGLTVKATLAGDGPQRAELEARARELGIDSHVWFPGAVGQEQIRTLYAGASVFCLASFAEGVPCVLMEAMAMEVPVVATQITGIGELIEDGHSGLLVRPSRADQLADALERLLGDPQLRRRLGDAGRETVLREFSAEASAEQMHELLLDELRWDVVPGSPEVSGEPVRL